MTPTNTRPIPGFADYHITSDGQIWSTKRGRARQLKSQVKPGCGYRWVRLQRDGRGFGRYVHRLVLEVFVGPCPSGHECRHINGDKLDNRVENLAWGTPKENHADMVRHGRKYVPGLRGEEHGMARLTAADVQYIRRHHQARHPEFGGRSLARRFGVSESTISMLICGNTWQSLEPPDA